MMVSINEFYKCEVCGNVVTLVEVGGGTLVCCGQDMVLLEEQTLKQEGKEKHVPVMDVKGNRVKVKVGSVRHPMEERHYIELIQIIKDGKIVGEKQLSPGDIPEAEFCLENVSNVRARAYCNLHGLWTS